MTRLELIHKLRETAFTMKSMAVVMAAYAPGQEWQTRARELEEAADMVMGWSCQKSDGPEWP